mmetsp:Transcript_7421/g.16199  ORF Transcript_7421/g.16199 Transcript_7421/m.16199 type:complete len:716 (-) Transcript_7421:273-2420(-)|eukprot:CAMPEP_0172530420 /NCGR_PEP_ID=MMETSP1067-20121228/4159_1 /TAXON_ID=265564 ORGANISM="Thalassiosira punctigera, Strain Tpunct2005C2" /NCGR_SAMPLE_ID=MMETSP1067 /ASSEMBLY_ACC=CAM_ASM_000444 /LENGTH=715 /DNA_ID=CAMNT_0013314627 /DNA_START=111 /DNA_END=2258 /DNA_ORIENTATION=+
MTTSIAACTSRLPRAARSLILTRSPFSSSAADPIVAATTATKPDFAQNRSNRSIKLPAAFALASASLLGGYLLGTSHSAHWEELQKDRELPKGERGCCSCDAASSLAAAAPEFTEAQSALSSKLQKIVGKGHVYDGMEETSKNAHFLKGARLGHGKALCVVQPGTVREAVDCLKEIVDAGCVVLPQGSNTGLTGGSVPRNDTPDTRPAVVLSMKRLDAHFPIDDGRRVVCLAGCGISTLASSIQSWFPERESHSILGSTFLNPTTAAGVAFGSGGVYVRKGPAMTDRALYCKVSRNKWGENVITVVNTLGVKGMEDTDFQEHSGQDAVGALDAYASDVRQGFRRPMTKSSDSVHGRAKASDSNYHNKVCECTEDVSRYNADTAGEDCNRSEGKVVILATVHDTFPVPKKKRVFWVSFPDMETTLAFRREVCLNNSKDLPISCEYLDRDSVDIIDRSGRIGVYMIRFLGMGDIMGFLWNIKVSIEGLPFSWAPMICDKLLHTFNNWIPESIPGKFMTAGRGWDHHCMVAVGEFGDGTLDRFMERMDAFVKKHNEKALSDEKDDGRQIVSVVEAHSDSEMTALNAFRFVAALAFKTYCVGEDIQGISVDYALPKNGGLAPPLAPSAAIPLKRMRYSHFGCNVVHEDIAYALGVDTHKEKMSFKHNVEDEGGKLPAEHGHGTEYHAPESSQKRWMDMDPLNVMNPGVGGLSTLPKYGK